MNLQNSFAFIHEGHEYYFTTKVDKESGFDCEFYVGFVDGRFKYAFPASRMADFKEYYSPGSSPENRIKVTQSHLEEFQRNDFLYLCSDKFNFSPGPIATLVGFSPLLIFIGPLLYKKDSAVHLNHDVVNLDDLRLGMSLKEVKMLINQRPLELRKENTYVLHVFDKADARVVMYFKDSKLFAWARGFKPQGFTFAPAPMQLLPNDSLKK